MKAPHPIGYDAKGGCIIFIILFLITLVLVTVSVLLVGEPEEPEYGWSAYTEKGKKWDREHP